MARARNIKPGFFTNDLLAEVDPLGRILFQGLWCHADREGRLEDRPKKIKAEILPYDDCDADRLLWDLADRAFIARYQVRGVRYIQVLSFGKHQNPHIKEGASIIPGPDDPDAEPVVNQGKHHTSTVQAQCVAGESSERAGLIPDSLNLIPDSGFPSLGEQVAPKAKQQPAEEKKSASAPSKRGCQLPDDFYPDAAGVDLAESIGVSVAVELPKFSDHHRAKGSAMKDWQAAWRTWARNAKKFAGSAQHPRMTQHQINQAGIAASLFGQGNDSRQERLISGEVVQ